MTKRRQETIKFLTFDELKRLIVIANKRDRALFLIAYRHGLRASEVGLRSDLNLSPEHVVEDFQQKW